MFAFGPKTPHETNANWLHCSQFKIHIFGNTDYEVPHI